MGHPQRALAKVVTLANADFWRGKNVFVTGHTGFKGSWLSLLLTRLGANVTGLALAPATQPSLFDAAGVDKRVDSHVGDIRDRSAVARLIAASRPEVVLHLAAQPLVRASYADPVGTFETNVIGTANVLDAIRSIDTAKVVVSITTDKVYQNQEWPHPYREDDRLGGHDPYSASKAAAEIVSASYADAFLTDRGVRLATARAGNVIGGGDWSIDRLLPDAVRAWTSGTALSVRRPASTRPWQHVIEPLTGYLLLAEHLWHRTDLPRAFNFGPDRNGSASVRDVVDLAQRSFGKGAIDYADTLAGPHEAGLLALDVERARSLLDFHPRWQLAETVSRTLDWYRNWYDGAAAAALCDTDFAGYGYR